MTYHYDRKLLIEEPEYCSKCGHLLHFHITRTKLCGSRLAPMADKCVVADCGCMRYDTVNTYNERRKAYYNEFGLSVPNEV